MFSTRTLISLSQYLGLHYAPFVRELFVKHGITIDTHEWNRYSPGPPAEVIRIDLEAADGQPLQELLAEMIRTLPDIRSRITPRYRHDLRWDDLILCLRLDGYGINGDGVVPIEPTIGEERSTEDDLTRELQTASLSGTEAIAGEIRGSGESFRRSPPDYNACLTHARVALHHLADAIASNLQSDGNDDDFDHERWGEILEHLRRQQFVTRQEEKGLAGVYTFISVGAHRPVDVDEEEMAWLGRSLAFSMCWFLIRRWNTRT